MIRPEDHLQRRRMIAERAKMRALLDQEKLTPAPWSPGKPGGAVIGPTPAELDERDRETFEFYGGRLVAESMEGADRDFVAAARGFVADILELERQALRTLEIDAKAVAMQFQTLQQAIGIDPRLQRIVDMVFRRVQVALFNCAEALGDPRT